MPKSSINSKAPTLFLGLDCGGSSTRALAIDPDSNPAYRGHAGAANLASTPEPMLLAHLRRAISDCPPPTHVCGCFAGLMTQGDRDRAKRLLANICPGAITRAEPDYYAALAASPPGTHVCLVSGTGSLVCSQRDGKIYKSGGRGFVLGDFGSGYRYGREFLRARMELGRLSEYRTELADIFGSSEESDILSVLYRRGPIATRLARLAQFFVKDVLAAEPYALDFLREESQRLAAVVVNHIEKYFANCSEINLCLAGGLWRISPMFEEEIAGRLNELSGGRSIERHRIRRAPVEGAVLLARELCDEHRIS